MALLDTQVRQLKAKLNAKHVRSRNSNGNELHYVEGWHVISEANRIFGFDAWDRQTLTTDCVWSGSSGDGFAAAYTARVRIRVRAGDLAIIRDGSGSGEGRAPTRGQAHDLALKAAETDATKRALATFGNPFGLALYDRDLGGVRKQRGSVAKHIGPFILRLASGAEAASLEKPSDFVDALRKALSGASNIEELFAIWEQNVDAVRAVHRALKQDHLPKSGAAPQLVAHFRRCAVALANARPNGQPQEADKESRSKIDKSVLAISEPRRLRSKERLRHVAKQPCLICGRSPCHAHHLRHAQPRGMALKVSDEFTVPLCAIHHDEIHRTTTENTWWLERGVDPLAVAAALWRESCGTRDGSLGQSDGAGEAAKSAEANNAARAPR